jgi:acyl-coenzyme A synthetase/AMP-(fatty) acid ligase
MVRNVFDKLHKYPITTLCSPPTAYRQYVLPDHQVYFAQNPPLALETCNAAGEPLKAQVIEVWRKMSSLEVRDGYGQTETTMLCGNLEGNKIKQGSMGVPVPGVPLSVIDNSGFEVGPHVEGDMAIATTTSEGSPTVNIFEGYLDSSGTVSRKPRNGWSKEWYLTGDRG